MAKLFWRFGNGQFQGYPNSKLDSGTLKTRHLCQVLVLVFRSQWKTTSNGTKGSCFCTKEVMKVDLDWDNLIVKF
jgi:hypothetical protein